MPSRSTPKPRSARDAHGNAVPLTTSRAADGELANERNEGQRRGHLDAGAMGKAPAARSRKARAR